MKDRKGFTLIEIIAVIVIIGVIAILIVPTVSGYIVNTRSSAYKSHERSMSEAAESYTIECINNNGKDCEIPGPNEEKTIYLNELIDEDFIDKLGDPAKTGGFCDFNLSYVRIENENQDDFKYTACLFCSNYETNNPKCTKYHGNDDTPPTCVALETHSEWTNESRQVKVGCNDTGSGCLRNEFKKTFTSTTDVGIITITDKNGNSTDCEVEVKVDKTSPTCEMTTDATPVNGWYRLGTVFRLSNYIDNESGVLTYGTGTTLEANFNKITEQVPPRGITRIFGYVQDMAGNIGTCSINSKIKTEFTIHYNPNLGTGTMLDKKCLVDDECILDLNTFTRVGYTFNGWNTRADGTGRPYTDGANVKNIVFSGEVTLYAQWKVITYTLTYNLGGGTVNPTNPTTYTIESNDITLNNPTKAGYTFEGWTGTGLSSATMNVKIPKGSTGNREYTATWQVKTVVVTFDCNGGTGGGTQSFTYGVAGQQFSTTCSRVGYTLSGWNKQSNGSGAHYSATSGVADSWIDSNYPSVTLYAEWTPKTVVVTFDCNEGTGGGTQTFTYGVTGQAFSTTCSRAGYTLSGWTDEKNGSSGYSVTSGVSDNWINSKSPSTTIYAKWTTDSKFTTTEFFSLSSTPDPNEVEIANLNVDKGVTCEIISGKGEVTKCDPSAGKVTVGMKITTKSVPGGTNDNCKKYYTSFKSHVNDTDGVVKNKVDGNSEDFHYLSGYCFAISATGPYYSGDQFRPGTVNSKQSNTPYKHCTGTCTKEKRNCSGSWTTQNDNNGNHCPGRDAYNYKACCKDCNGPYCRSETENCFTGGYVNVSGGRKAPLCWGRWTMGEVYQATVKIYYYDS